MPCWRARCRHAGPQPDLRRRRGRPRPARRPGVRGRGDPRPARPIEGLEDSKLLSSHAARRARDRDRTHALAWAVASASVEEIDASTSCRPRCWRCGAPWKRSACARTRPGSTATTARELACRARGDRAGRRQHAGDLRGIDPRQDRARRGDAAPARALSRIRLRPPQGLPDAGAPGCSRAHGPCEIHRRSFAPVRRVAATPHDRASALARQPARTPLARARRAMAASGAESGARADRRRAPGSRPTSTSGAPVEALLVSETGAGDAKSPRW